MAIKGIRLAIAKTATRLSQPENDAATGNSIVFTSPTPKNLYLGGANVTNSGANQGALLPAGTTPTFTMGQSDDVLYACVADADDGTIFDVLAMGV